jgi:hypothetical protein
MSNPHIGHKYSLTVACDNDTSGNSLPPLHGKKKTRRSYALPSHFKQHYRKSASVAACTMFLTTTAITAVASRIRHSSPKLTNIQNVTHYKLASFQTSRYYSALRMLRFNINCTNYTLHEETHTGRLTNTHPPAHESSVTHDLYPLIM